MVDQQTNCDPRLYSQPEAAELHQQGQDFCKTKKLFSVQMEKMNGPSQQVDSIDTEPSVSHARHKLPTKAFHHILELFCQLTSPNS